MTTHFVEIRPSLARRREAKVHDLADLARWEVLTLTPVHWEHAESLCKVIGPHWEHRIVAASEVDHVELARHAIFDIVEALPEGKRVPRWKKVAVVHHPDCTAPDVEWTTGVASDMTSTQWLAFQVISQNVTKAQARAHEIGNEGLVSISPIREHTGHCAKCGGHAKGMSVQVTIVSGCRHMVREYAL